MSGCIAAASCRHPSSCILDITCTKRTKSAGIVQSAVLIADGTVSVIISFVYIFIGITVAVGKILYRCTYICDQDIGADCITACRRIYCILINISILGSGKINVFGINITACHIGNYGRINGINAYAHRSATAKASHCLTGMEVGIDVICRLCRKRTIGCAILGANRTVNNRGLHLIIDIIQHYRTADCYASSKRAAENIGSQLGSIGCLDRILGACCAVSQSAVFHLSLRNTFIIHNTYAHTGCNTDKRS